MFVAAAGQSLLCSRNWNSMLAVAFIVPLFFLRLASSLLQEPKQALLQSSQVLKMFLWKVAWLWIWMIKRYLSTFRKRYWTCFQVPWGVTRSAVDHDRSSNHIVIPVKITEGVSMKVLWTTYVIQFIAYLWKFLKLWYWGTGCQICYFKL